MSKNAMIIMAVVAIVIFSYIFWKKRQAASGSAATATATAPTS